MIVDGWHSSAEILHSPNFNQRPEGTLVDMLVIHNISLPPEEYGGGFVQKFFLNQLDHDAHPYFETIEGLEVSSHFLVERDATITQFVSLADRAWHAGKSEFRGRTECNDFSIGIELEGCDHQCYTDSQYARLVELSADIMNTYPHITLDRIVGHNDISPGRKSDPGESFDWSRYKTLLKKQLSGE